MKKIISAILATLMLFTLAACGEESTPAEATAQTTKATTAEKEIQTTTTADPNAPKEIDVFEFVEVIYSGISPDGTAEINYDEIPDELADNAEFTIDKTEGLKNGDTITLTCIPEESLLVFENIVPTRLTKEVTIENLPVYISDISTFDLTNINSEIETILKSCVATNLNTRQISDFEDGETKVSGMSIISEYGENNPRGGNGSIDIWAINNAKYTLEGQYFYKRKTPIDDNSKVKYDNILLSIYRADITATKSQHASDTDGYAEGEQGTFVQYVSAYAVDLNTSDETNLKFELQEWQVRQHDNLLSRGYDGVSEGSEGWVTDVESAYLPYVKAFSEDYDVVKIN